MNFKEQILQGIPNELPDAKPYDQQANHAPRRKEILTDVEKKLKLLMSRGLEVILFHVLDSDEVSFPFDGDVVFESLEDDSSIELDPADIRETYQRSIQEQIKYYRFHCAKLGIDYIFLETSTPLEQGLTYYLLQRKNLGKH